MHVLRSVLCRATREAKDERGQAAVESALVIPLMTFLILGVIQLVLVQHARIMTEYAAFNAARAGIVWNADRIIMEDAAIISLLPTYEGLLKQSDLGDATQMLKRIAQRALLYQVSRRLPQAIDLLQNGTNRIIDKIPIPIKQAEKKARENAKEGVKKLLDLAGAAAATALLQAFGRSRRSATARHTRSRCAWGDAVSRSGHGANSLCRRRRQRRGPTTSCWPTRFGRP